MDEGRSSISNAKSYGEIGEFWDTHDLGDYWDQTESVEFEIDLCTESRYYALDKHLAQKLDKVAEEHGVSAGTLLNLWVQEKLLEGAPGAV